VGVTRQRSLGVTVLGLIAGEVPDDQGLVAGSRQEHVGAVQGRPMLATQTVFRSISKAGSLMYALPSTWGGCMG
jgi:hypothetical protein